MRIGGTVGSGVSLGILGVLAIVVSHWNAPQKATEIHQAKLHKQMQARLASGMFSSSRAPAVCFAPGTPNDVIDAFNQSMGTGGNDRFQIGSGWFITATDGVTGGAGSPITLTYSFVPDGTPLASGAGEPADRSDFFATMNSIYAGGPAQWQPLFRQMFARWGEMIGVTYVFEPNDDGAASPGSDGSIGVRGDVRIGGHFIDGNSGILAFNFFPDAGDMTFDTGDSFYTSLHANSVRLRNVASHEHGHGLGVFHVCPVVHLKLMEPTVTAAFDEIQHDEIRAGHAQYGDIFEPNDSTGTAFDFGSMIPGDTVDISDPQNQTFGFGSQASLSGTDGLDFYSLNTTAAARLSVSVVPLGMLYDDSSQSCGGQPSSCCNGSFTNSLTIADLTIDVIDGGSMATIASANANGIGLPENIISFQLPSGGTYFVRVSAAAAPADVQLYSMSLAVDDAFLEPTISFPSGVPNLLDTTSSTTFNVQIDPGDDTITTGTMRLRYRYDGGVFLAVPLGVINAASGQFTATLPAPLCASTPEFFVEVNSTISGITSNPLTGAAAPLTASVGTAVTLVSLNFETDPGWTVVNSAGLFDGAWELGVPVNCGRSDPPADFDGSGQCWLTTNDPLDCNSDVDGGTTILESVSYDISGLLEPKVSYARWYDNHIGSAGQEDTMFVTVSPDGGASWLLAEQIGPSYASAVPDIRGGWIAKTIDLGPLVGATTQFRIRFFLGDAGLGSIVEAGVDAFSITGNQCSDIAVPCAGDANGDGVVNFADITEVLGNWLNDYTPGTGPGDANGDGLVNFADITEVLGNWLFICP